MNETYGTGCHKGDVGRFLATARRAAGLTQKELAASVFVTESAVSKWERGLSYPDLATLGPLAQALGVTEGELVSASADDRGRLDAHQARVHRRWRAALLRTTIGAYAVALVATFVTNLAVEHTLSWFWIVASAVALAFSLTTLPLLVTGRRGWTTFAAALVSLGLLLASVEALTSAGFLGVTGAAILFAAVVVWGPLALRSFGSGWLRAHSAAVAVVIDAVGLTLMLAVILGAVGQDRAFVEIALPLVAGGFGLALLIVLVIRYLPLRGLQRAAIVCLVAGVVAVVAGPLVDGLLGHAPVVLGPVDLTTWSDATINGNVTALIAGACVLTAMVLGVLSFVLRRGDRPDAADVVAI
ncbi:helix-turn-helix domain-containing protein [Microbacterium arborescens]|uniref:helix-turn-helix domain-containing protein n=1 Tax=Microbacterium arborescens TaxID=33883 RepID=UPI0025A000C6|nr:helix-turn-helix transcriptional regulator [Microbacterium arborescens]WJM15323.1 helix-turn-helix transcriptional regulator [Microbacterium arborescens]